MAVTTTSTMSNSVQKLYNSDYMLATSGEEFYDQLSYTKESLNGRRGSAVEFTIGETLDVATSTLSQTSDVTPVAQTDSAATITLAEYGEPVAAF